MKKVFFFFFLFSHLFSYGQLSGEEIRAQVKEYSSNKNFIDSAKVVELYQEAKILNDKSLITLVQFLGLQVKSRSNKSKEVDGHTDELLNFLEFIDHWEKNKDTSNLLIGYSFIADALYRMKVYEYSIVYLERKIKLKISNEDLVNDIYSLAESHLFRHNYGPAINVLNKYLPRIRTLSSNKDSINFIFNQLLIEAYNGKDMYKNSLDLAEVDLKFGEQLSSDKIIDAYFNYAQIKINMGESSDSILQIVAKRFEDKPETHSKLLYKFVQFYYHNKFTLKSKKEIDRYLEENKGSIDEAYTNAIFLKGSILYAEEEYKEAFKVFMDLLDTYRKYIKEEQLEKIEKLTSSTAEKLGKNKVALEHLRKHIKIRDELREIRIEKRNRIEEVQFWFQKSKNKVEFNSRLNNLSTIDSQSDSLRVSETLVLKAENLANRRFYVILITLLIALFGGVTLFYTWKTKKAHQKLLLNILPSKIIEKIKNKEPTIESVDKTTVLFTDFKGFTMIAEELSAEELVAELNECFGEFDAIMDRHNLEKIKTIGDAYMAAGGIPEKNDSNPVDAIYAAMEIVDFIEAFNVERKINNQPLWNIRIGINTGHIVAGVIGTHKYSYDIWGDAVNLASRMESSGEEGKINISENTYQLVKDKFECTFRGEIKAKNKGNVKMYFVEGRK